MMDRLDEDIVMDILTRLPISSLMRCSCICKRWCKLARDRRFIQFHLMNRSAQENPSLLLQSTNYGKMYLLEAHDWSCREVTLPPIYLPNYEVIGSCNGVCLIHCIDRKIDIYYLLNPITGSYLRLPELIWVPWSFGIEVGFNSENNKYKVVALKKKSDDDDEMQSEVVVHTVGFDDGCWRGMGYVPYVINSQSALEGVFVEGAIHWVCSSTATATANANANNLIIVSFSIANEVFAVIPHPAEINSSFSLAVLGGCLSITVDSSFGNCVQVWMMKDYGVEESWTKCLSINYNQVGRRVRKVKTYYFGPRISNLKALCFEKDGQLLVLDNHCVLDSYNPRTKALKKLSINPSLPTWTTALTHVGSLVSFSVD